MCNIPRCVDLGSAHGASSRLEGMLLPELYPLVQGTLGPLHEDSALEVRNFVSLVYSKRKVKDYSKVNTEIRSLKDGIMYPSRVVPWRRR